MRAWLVSAVALGAVWQIHALASHRQCASAGLRLQPGFCATVFADNLGLARHLTVSSAGDVYVILGRPRIEDPTGSVIALRDVDGDGRADIREGFFENKGDDIEWQDNRLFVSTPTAIFAWTLQAGQLAPNSPPDVVVDGFPQYTTPEHSSKTFALVGNALLVHVGAPSDSCQAVNRLANSPGVDPCPLLDASAGIWRFDKHKLGQRARDGIRVASGIRHSMGLALDPRTQLVYAVVHGRDLLNLSWPSRFTEEESADLPSDELIIVKEGANYGWPYCYHDPRRNLRVLSPEYGGDGTQIGNCRKYAKPATVFPAHSAPNDLIFYSGHQFPSRFRNGAFVAFHGGWGRRPFSQRGYSVAFVPFDQGSKPGSDFQVFADGFAGTPIVREPRDAQYRPVGLAVAPDGALFISDSRQGRVWRIIYSGKGSPANHAKS